MQKALPRGIRILAADVTATNAPALMAEAGGADYRVTLPYDKPVDEAVAAFNGAESIIYAKAAPKAKTKVKEIDVKFLYRILRLKTAAENWCLLSAAA